MLHWKKKSYICISSFGFISINKNVSIVLALVNNKNPVIVSSVIVALIVKIIENETGILFKQYKNLINLSHFNLFFNNILIQFCKERYISCRKQIRCCSCSHDHLERKTYMR